MHEEQQWLIAWARFDALRKNIPPSIDQERVNEYHAILDEIHLASGRTHDMHSFRIHSGEMKPKVTSFRKGTRRVPPVVRYSDKKYCDRDYFVRQIEAAWKYLSDFEANRVDVKQLADKKDYWAMLDVELERLANKYHIPPWSRSGPNLEHWYVDRNRIIHELVKRDNALRAGNPLPSNVLHVGTMVGSSVQQGTSQSHITTNFKAQESDLRTVLMGIRDSMAEIDLSEAAKQQLTTDVSTVEVQLSSPNPRSSIITECLHSMKTILENAVGSVIGSGLAYEVAKYLGQ